MLSLADKPRLFRTPAKGKIVAILLSLSFIAYSPSVFAASCTRDNLRWASSSNTLYIIGDVSCRLTDLKALLPTVPLTLVDPDKKIWFLRANLKLEQGATLPLVGSSSGGDVDELRLKSNNTSAANSIIWIRAQWGTILMRGVRVTSWNEADNAPDTEYGTYKRSYIHVRSYLDADGVTPRQSRMDILDSDVGYLGHYAAESYGLVWKVSGASPGLYDTVDVLGDVMRSRIHHNYFGAYTYGAYGMNWKENEIDHNVAYGLDPHDDSDALVIEGNTVHDNGNHGIICSQRCDHLTIRNNTSTNNRGNGIMLHRNTNDSLVEENNTARNSDSGIAIFDSHRNTVRNNTIAENDRGIRLSVGSAENLIENNTITDSKTYGIYFYKGTDPPTSGDGRPKRNQLLRNTVRKTGSYAISLKESDENTFVANTFSDIPNKLVFERGLGNVFRGNTIPQGLTLETKGSSSIAASTLIDEEPRISVTMDSYSTSIFQNPQGYVFDPLEETTLATAITPTGSRLSLTKQNTGSAADVMMRNLVATLSSGTVTVNPTVWETSGTRKKAWKTTAPSKAQSVQYAVGDLAPDTEHLIRKNGTVLSSQRTDATGVLTFTDTVGSTNPVTYTVELL